MSDIHLLDAPKHNYVVRATIEFVIAAPNYAYANKCANSIAQELDEASVRGIYGGYTNAVRSRAPAISRPKATDKKLPKYPACRR